MPRRTGRSLLCVLVSLATIAAALPAQADRTSVAGAKAAPAGVQRSAALGRQLGLDARGARELRSLRTRTSKTYVTRSGRRIARVYSGAIHVRDRQGRWQNVDSRLRRAGDRLVNRRNGYSAALPARLGARGAVRVRRGSRWVAFRLRGAQGTARVAGNVARYASALPNVDVAYRLNGDAVKETLTLRSPATPRRFVFDLSASAGLRPSVLRSGGVVLRDRRGRTRLSMAAPFMVDARRRTRGVALAVARTQRGWRLTMTLDRRWLASAKRRWPVVVDPAVYPGPDRDCGLDSWGPETSLCANDFLEVGNVDGHDHHAALRFDVAGAVPRGATVDGSTIGVYARSTSTAVWTAIEANPITQEWTGSASWNRKDGTDRWSEPGGEVDTSERADFTNSIGADPGWVWLNTFKIVRDWATGKRPNHGIMLSTATQDNGAVLDSSESATASRRPYLEIAYTMREGERRGYVHDRQQLSDAISLGVNVASGNLLLRSTDFARPGGLGPTVTVARSYNSLSPEYGAFGNGWNLDTGQDVGLQEWAGANFVRVSLPSGMTAVYYRKSDGTYQTPAGFNNTLKRNADGTWTITEHESQSKLHFGSQATDGRLSAYEDRNGRRVSVTYTSGGLVDRVTGSTGDFVSFTHNGVDEVTQMTDPAGRPYVYGYDAGDQLTSSTDPANGITRYEYAGQGGRLSKVTTPGGRITLVDYYPAGHADCGKVKSVTRVTNATAMTGPTTTFEYRTRRDGSGEAEVTDPIGSASDDANDRVTRYEFDEQGRVTTTKDALGREAKRELTSNSRVQSYTSAANTGTTPNTSFTFDSATDMLTGTSTSTGAGSGAITTSNAYGESARVAAGTAGSEYLPTSGENERGDKTQMSYVPPTGSDLSGNLYSVKRLNAASGTASQVDFRYDTAPDGKGGRLVGVKDGRGNETTYGYDADGNVNRMNVPQPAIASGALPGPTDMTYHATLARVEKVQDGARNWRCLAYDNRDRVTAIRYSVDSVCDDTDDYVKYTYDPDGNLLTEVDKVGGTTTNTYDKLNRLTYEALPGGRSATYTYDPVGNLTSLADAGGKVEYTYDALNDQRSVYEPGTAKPTKFEHDKDGRRTKTTYPNGVATTQVWDGASRLTEIASAKGATTLQKLTYAYLQGTKENWLQSEAVDVLAARRTRYAYDDLDRLQRARTESTTVTPTATTTACATAGGLACYEYTLDGAGNRLKERVTGTGVASRVVSYGYNKANQLCWWTPTDQTVSQTTDCPAKPVGAHAPAYDANGNETSLGTGRTAAYNRRDQTTSFTIGATATPIGYLGAGQSRWVSEGTTTFQHNVLGLGAKGSTYFTRDEGGTPVSNRTGTSRSYYLLDAAGSVTGLTDSTGAVTRTYRYEPYGKVESTTGTAVDPLRYAGGYETVGGLYHYGQRYYDPAHGRWTQPDPLDQSGDLMDGNAYVYAAADPINMADPTGLHSTGTNGCTKVPDSGPGFNFHRSCDGHDLCYRARRGRAYCDRGFRRSMRRTCGRRGFVAPNCFVIAEIYYRGVRLLGGFRYPRDPHIR